MDAFTGLLQPPEAVKPENPPNACAQFGAVKWLGDEIVRARVDAEQTRFAVIKSRHHYNSYVGELRVSAQTGAYLEAVHAGHHHVEKDQIRLERGSISESCGAVSGAVQREFRVIKQLFEGLPVRFDVVNDQDNGLSHKTKISD